MSGELKKLVMKISKKSDTKAFRSLFNQYNDRLLKIALYYIKSEVLAEEITADVFISIWKNRERLLEIDKFDYYLFTSVKRRCIDEIRKKGRNRTIPMEVVHEQTFALNSRPDKEMLYREFEMVVKSAIGLLTPKTQLIYKMIKEDHLKYKDVAEILDITDKAVEYHIGKAFKIIKENIERYQSDEQRIGYIHRSGTAILIPAMLVLEPLMRLL